MKTRSMGMTLIELMTALTVLGILTAIAVPTFREFMANSRTTATTNDVVTALNIARSEALRRATNVIACASTNQTTCSGSNNWATGWVVFADPNGNGAVDGGELVQVWSGPTGGVAVTALNAANNDVSSVVYNAMGMGQLPPGGRIRFSVVAAGCSGNRAGQTDVLLAGTIQSRKVACP